jgi:SAM-dependent methyltransferase
MATYAVIETPASGTNNPPPALSQRGRAGLDILGSIQKCASSDLRERARANFEADPVGRELTQTHRADLTAEEMRDRLAPAKAAAQKDPIYRLERFCQRYVAEENFVRGVRAIEENREAVLNFLEATPAGEATIQFNPEVPLPDYYDGVEFHLEPGGWDGYDLYGSVLGMAIGPRVFVHGGYAAVGVGDNIAQQRVDAIAQLPKDRYERVFEPGCGSFATLAAVAARFPEAEVVGCDLSLQALKGARALAARRNLKAVIKQADALETGEPDASFDAVVTYALHHELPIEANRKLFAEMLRILKPGGDIVMTDPPPLRAVSPFHGVILDWDTEHREEPFFTEACLANWDEELRAAGFEAVESYGLGKDGYPWITRARKPA